MNRTPPPTRFSDAEKIGPFQVLVDLHLHDQALGSSWERCRGEVLTDVPLAAAGCHGGADGSP